MISYLIDFIMLAGICLITFGLYTIDITHASIGGGFLLICFSIFLTVATRNDKKKPT